MRHPALWAGTLAIIGALAVAFLVLSLRGGGSGDRGKDNPPYSYAVQMFEDIGRTHFPVGQTYDQYNSNPPTSGPHAAAPAAWGVHDEAVAKEQAVHNMEHGGVVVWYNCNGGETPLTTEGCAQLRDRLAAIVRSALDDGLFILMTPYAEMENQIALTAWQYLDAFDQFDEAHVRAFIASFECKFNPENLCR